MKILKRNQVVVFVIGLMLIAAGYLNFTNNEGNANLVETSALADSEQMAAIGDAQLVSTFPTNTNVVDENTIEENKVVEEDMAPDVEIEKAEGENKAVGKRRK